MATDERRIEYIPLAELLTRLHPRNPKDHDISAIVASYKYHGFVASGVIDSRTGLFLAGHGRIKALARMKQQGMEAPNGIRNGGADWLVPVQTGYESESDDAALAYLAADNKLTELGGWDEPLLAELLQEIHNSGEIALEASGFDADDLDTLLNDLGMMGEPTPDPGAQVDRAAELQEKWQVKRGDVWQVASEDGKRIHRVMCGDSTCKEDVDKLMGGVKADAVVTDPPYGMSYQPNHNPSRIKHNYNGAGYHNVSTQTMIKGDDTPFDPLPIIENIGNIKEQFWFGADYYCPRLPEYEKGSWLVWDKRVGIEDMNFKSSHFELCWSKQKHMREIIRVKWFGIQGTEKQDVKHRIHPTQKPIEVITWILERYCGDLIIDPFLGSGTTMVSAEQLGKTCFGFEIEPKYCAVILERMAAMGLQPKRVDDE
jgi:hypothetical protein